MALHTHVIVHTEHGCWLNVSRPPILKQNPDKLSESGFFYIGKSMKGQNPAYSGKTNIFSKHPVVKVKVPRNRPEGLEWG
jgi:hypothetical protein